MRRWIFLCLCLFCLSATAYAAPVVTTQEVEEALTCQCGCGLTIHSCNHLQCGFAVPAKQEIARLVSEGKSKPEVLSQFAAKYGEKVLSAPTASGFNLVAWITPFLAVLVGGVLVGLVVVRWSRKAVSGPAKVPTPGASESCEQSPLADASLKYRERLKKELEAFDR